MTLNPVIHIRKCSTNEINKYVNKNIYSLIDPLINWGGFFEFNPQRKILSVQYRLFSEVLVSIQWSYYPYSGGQYLYSIDGF